MAVVVARYLLVDCNGDIVGYLYDLPLLGEWDENAVLYNVECVRDAFCETPSSSGCSLRITGRFIFLLSSGPIDGPPCYVQIECDGDVVVGNDLAAEIPCEDYCAGNRIPKKSSLSAYRNSNDGLWHRSSI